MPIAGVHQPAAKPDISKPVDNVGNAAGGVDSTSQALQAKIDTLKDTVKDSKDSLERANSKVELLKKQGSANAQELGELWNLVQEVKARNAILETSVEDAKITMDNQRQAIAKLNTSITEARNAAAQKDAEVSALRESVMEANNRLQQASIDQSRLLQQQAKDRAELTVTQEKLSNAKVYKWWFIGIVATVILALLAKFLIPILVKSVIPIP